MDAAGTGRSCRISRKADRPNTKRPRADEASSGTPCQEACILSSWDAVFLNTTAVCEIAFGQSFRGLWRRDLGLCSRLLVGFRDRKTEHAGLLFQLMPAQFINRSGFPLDSLFPEPFIQARMSPFSGFHNK